MKHKTFVTILNLLIMGTRNYGSVVEYTVDGTKCWTKCGIQTSCWAMEIDKFMQLKKYECTRNVINPIGVRDDDDESQKLPNIDYLLIGYNIYYGNPKQTEASTDPGFKVPIFDSIYSGRKSGDRKYELPDGVSVL